MSDGELPRAIATAGGEPGGSDAVRPRRAAIVAGGLVAVFACALLFVVTPPTWALRLVGGPSSDLARYGGLRLVWEPPPGYAGHDLDHYERAGNAYVVEAPHVRREEVARTAQRLAGTGRLEFHVVVETKEMADLVRVLDLPMRGREPLDAMPDAWTPEVGGGRHDDIYLRARTRDQLDHALAEAAGRGWKLPPGTHIAYEHSGDAWRTYVLADEVALDASAIDNAVGSYDPYTNRPVVLLEFTREGARTFGELTARIAGHKLATVLDGEVKSAPIINTAIRGGRAQITMGAGDTYTQERERDDLVATLASGSLPRGGTIVEATYVEPADVSARLAIARVVLAAAAGLAGAGLAWLAIGLLRPYRRRERWLTGKASIAVRLAWCALGLVIYTLGSRIVLPGVNEVELTHVIARGRGGYGLLAIQQLSVFALGIMPVITSYVTIEIVASIVPRWRKLRDVPAGRRKLGIAVGIATVIVATVQAYFVASYMESLSHRGAEIVPHPGMAWRWLVVATLVAGTMSLAWLASMITQRGIGNGYAVLIVGSWLLGLPARVDSLTHAELALFAVAVLAVAVVYLVASSWRVRGLRSASIPVPAAGTAPLSDAGGVMIFLDTLALLGVYGEGIARAADWLGPLHYESIAFLLVVVMSAVWTFAFARPGRRARELAKAELTPPTREMWLRSWLLSALVLVLVRAIVRVAGLADLSLVRLLDPVMLLVVTAAAADLVLEALARRRGLVAVWPLHDPLLADTVADRLAAAGIDAHVQHRRLRSLLWIFGAYIPMHVLVPADQAEDAGKLVAALFE